LLEEAVSKPGTLMRAYALFWNYSLGNQILALIQANRRGIPLGPLASFNRWKEVGRHVKWGEEAIELYMPVTCKRIVKEDGSEGNEAESEITFKRLVFRRNWFMLSQTDGSEYQRPSIPAHCRGYTQNWLQGATIPERSAQRIFAAADKILKAGIEPLATGGAE
jgi:hypothetical protein